METPRFRGRAVVRWTVVAAFVALPAGAHELGALRVAVRFANQGYRADLEIDTREALAALAVEEAELPAAVLAGSALEFDGEPARPEAEVVAAPRGRLHLRWTGPVPAGARFAAWTCRLPLGAYPLRFESEGEPVAVRRWMAGPGTSPPYALASRMVPPTAGEVLLRYLELGFLHILPGGLDHILFVLGIFLLGRRLRDTLAQASAFTLAHTLTLGLTLGGVLAAPPRLVEPLIALSIAWVAIENLLVERVRRSRLVLVFTFGLLHGLGFAAVLGELGLPRGRLLLGLVGFNAGVEAGQATILLAAFLLVALPLRGRSWYRRAVVQPSSALIAAAALVWTVERLLP